MENMTEEEKAEQEKKFKVSDIRCILTQITGNFDETLEREESIIE